MLQKRITRVEPIGEAIYAKRGCRVGVSSMARYREFRYRGDDVLGSITAHASSNDDLAKLFADHKGPIVNKWHHYFPIYTRYFDQFRNRPTRFLEIGVSKGGSLEIWRKYLGPDAVIFGIDIDPACAKFDGLAAQVRIGSQDDPDFLNKVVDEMGGIDVVLDDGSHHMDHIPVTLETLFPRLAENGVYMIEDLHTSYWPKFGGGLTEDGNFFNYLRRIADVMHRNYLNEDVQFGTGADYNHISGLHIYDSVAVLEKAKPFTPRFSKIGS
ncbi:Methyltransferase domain-containing protein [Yoonia rosea]|uniref:Methyltransferase domain-containing protein n=1 Tax=Yoonia rosea TaxID=287098 RepID=A0A1R3X185_9RHOB|nr:Methyltransferase domain-containing protein [Yoonia rosea]